MYRDINVPLRQNMLSSLWYPGYIDGTRFVAFLMGHNNETGKTIYHTDR